MDPFYGNNPFLTHRATEGRGLWGTARSHEADGPAAPCRGQQGPTPPQVPTPPPSPRGTGAQPAQRLCPTEGTPRASEATRSKSHLALRLGEPPTACPTGWLCLQINISDTLLFGWALASCYIFQAGLKLTTRPGLDSHLQCSSCLCLYLLSFSNDGIIGVH